MFLGPFKGKKTICASLIHLCGSKWSQNMSFSPTVWSVFFSDNTHLFSKHLSSVGSLDSISCLPTLDGWTVHHALTHTLTHTPTDNLQSPVHLYAACLWKWGKLELKTLNHLWVKGRHFWRGVDARLLNLTEYSRQKTVLLIQSRSPYSAPHLQHSRTAAKTLLHPSLSWKHKLQTLLCSFSHDGWLYQCVD